MTTEVEDLLSEWQGAEHQKGPWMDHWQELAEVFLPGRADFTQSRFEGEKRTEKIFDGTPLIARRGLASAINGLLKPKTTRWFRVTPVDDDLADDDEVKEWLELVDERMWRAIYNPRAKFVQASSETDDDLVTFGTGVLMIRESKNLNHLLFRSQHLKHISFMQNSEGDFDTGFSVMNLTPRQAVQEFGEEKVGLKTRELLKDAAAARRFITLPYLRVVKPAEETEGVKTDMPFAVVDIDVKSEHKMGDGGFNEFPWATPRFDTRSEEIYGRSAAMLALPDSQTLQQQAKTILRQGHKVVDPPLAVAHDSVLSNVRTRPGGVTYVDSAAVRDFGGRVPIQPIQTGGNLALGREMQQDTRDQIMAAFFRNVLNLPIDGPQMTATEVLERRQEFLQTVGPVFDRLESEYPAVIVRRVFRIMDRAGAFPQRPEALREAGVRFEFKSPVQQARRQVEAAGLGRAFELLAPLAEIKGPAVFDHFDEDEIARDAPEVFGLPQRWLKSDDEVAATRTARAEAQEAQELAQAAEVGGGLVKNLADADANTTKAQAALQQASAA